MGDSKEKIIISKTNYSLEREGKMVRLIMQSYSITPKPV